MSEKTVEPKYPEIEVCFSEIDGNAFMLLGSVRRAMRKAGIDAAKIEEFADEAKSGDYDHLIQTCMAWVTIT